jgi:probable F420-dependent oxidoreductase
VKLGVVFPQTEIGNDPQMIARFATTAEALGYDHIIAYDHVLGASTRTRPDWKGPYTSDTAFHEVFVLFGYLAARTTTLELFPGVIILPQRQTALVAKQAASLDVLSKGRLRLGVGIGWNDVEYEALGENFKNRGARCEEQIDLMRKLWADEVISYEGRWHKVTEAGLNPLPTRRSIPVWLGGMAPQVVDRVARFGDGWIPHYNPDLRNQIAHMREAARAAGRDPAKIGVETMTLYLDDASKARDRMKELQDMGVTHTAVVTMKLGLRDPAAHIDAIARYREAVGDLADGA